MEVVCFDLNSRGAIGRPIFDLSRPNALVYYISFTVICLAAGLYCWIHGDVESVLGCDDRGHLFSGAICLATIF